MMRSDGSYEGEKQHDSKLVNKETNANAESAGYSVTNYNACSNELLCFNKCKC